MGTAEVSMAFMPYGLWWRTHRKLFNDFISVSTAENYDFNQVKSVSNFLVNLHKKPAALGDNIELCVLHLSDADSLDSFLTTLHPDLLVH